MIRQWKYIICILSIAATTIWLAVILYPDSKLHLVACDVGQGDAILVKIEKIQVLIDGGPDNEVLNCLNKQMPFWDRTIELVILTHPEKDHFWGLIEVFKRYRVKTLLISSLDSSSQEYQLLKSIVGGSDTNVVRATTGMVIRHNLLYLDIVHPSREFIQVNSTIIEDGKPKNLMSLYTTKRNTNDFSIVAILRYKKFKALLTGDIQPPVTDMVVEALKNYSVNQDVNYIKIPHHGSKNRLTKNLLDLTKPEIAIISVGENNIYGHPHDEILKLLSRYKIRVLRTDTQKDIEIMTDGDSWWLVN